MTLFRTLEQDERYHIADLNIDQGAQFVQDFRKRRAQRNQFNNLPFARQLAAYVVVEIVAQPELG
jgi:hypothetical protein